MGERRLLGTCARPSRLTITCSELDHHKVHARHRHTQAEIGVGAPQVRRPAADVGRYAPPSRLLLGIVTLLLLSLPRLSITAQMDVLAPVRFMLGNWTGTSSGEPGYGTAVRSYSLVLGEKFIYERNQTTYPPQEKNKKGEVHEHWSLIGYDSARKLVTFRQFHQEGFVATYVLSPALSTTGKVVFESEQLENIGASWRARETYELISATEFVETFELSQSGKPFEIYSKTQFKRSPR